MLPVTPKPLTKKFCDFRSGFYFAIFYLLSTIYSARIQTHDLESSTDPVKNNFPRKISLRTLIGL